jgi:hypothetical protein
VVTRVGLQKTQEFTPGSDVYDLVYAGERERILRACFVQGCIINTYPPFSILFWYENRIGYPIQVLNLLNEVSGQEPGYLLVKAPHALLHRPQTGLDAEGVFSDFLETPNISTGLHANMSLLRRRKLMSSLSYLGYKLASTCKVLEGSPTLICTALASSYVLKTSNVVGMARLGGTVGI